MVEPLLLHYIETSGGQYRLRLDRDTLVLDFRPADPGLERTIYYSCPVWSLTPSADQTFHRTLVASDRLYYAHPEHGGPTGEPLRADFTPNVDQHLGTTMRFARETHPQYDWKYSRLLVQVVPFSSQKSVEDQITGHARARALAKLTPEERVILGLEPRT